MIDPIATSLPLFVAVNSGCNMKCWYCTEFGESRDTTRGKLALGELCRLIDAAYEVGFRVFRFTGGEPTLRDDLPDVLIHTQQLGTDVQLAITTNGARLPALLPTLANLKSPLVFLSVDGIRKTSTSGDYQIEKVLTPDIQKLISQLQQVAKVRLNYVLTRNNVDQLNGVITFCLQSRLDIKIFELLLRNYHYAGSSSSLAVFLEQYYPVKELVGELKNRYGSPLDFPGLGGRGVPMKYFQVEDIKVIYFDTSVGSHYNSYCKGCSH